jgi:hypothetical protein
MYMVTLFIEVEDEEAVLAAAAQWLVKNGGEPDIPTARKVLANDVSSALRLLVDPDYLPGCDVHDSSVEFMPDTFIN